MVLPGLKLIVVMLMTLRWKRAQLDDPKFGIPDEDREYLLQMKAELPEVLEPDLEPEELMTEDQIQEELDRHKMMLNVVDEADIEFNSTTWEVLDAETGDMVEWFDEEELESKKELEYWELAQSDSEDPRFKPRWDPDPPSKYNYKNPPNSGGGFTWDKIRDRAEWHQFDENLRLKTEEGWHRFDYKEVQVREDLFDVNAANLTHGHIDPRVVERIQPCLTVLGKAVELLEADDGVVRFLYHGLIRDKVGVEAYAKMLMEENGYPEIKSVLCECRRVRDYDGFEASYF